MRTDETVFLKDYRPTPYTITAVAMEVEFAPGPCRVFTQLTITPRSDTPRGTPLVLDGDGLALKAVAIDAAPLFEADYIATADSLTIINPPLREFVLDTEVVIEPERNTALMGLYRSNGVWCTQCEPEGFRRITYYLDRPDVLARFSVKMIADKGTAPVLLSNGNLVESGELDEKRHFALWHDPFPKPAYLFAMVAGDLGSTHDSFTTMSGRKVALGIYCEHGKEDQCAYAMDSLKRAMAWDERRFGREYDLDIFNIVAVSDFNFGAMENKGLNIFNDRLVFAKPETASDSDYLHIEGVIAHEYFHNWTGNRITCRDWFQLCLKEGLTVFRDQEFTMDERSRPVARIEDVRTLKAIQFPEDASPLAHPPRPEQYKEINNFYTATVYEKGAEVVRMLATLLGPETFRKGTDLYFERHDGQATTIEAWLKVFEDASGRDLSQFATWYTQAGTPELTIADRYDPDAKTYTVTLRQKTAPTPGQPQKDPLLVPIRFGLLGPNGAEMDWSGVRGEAAVENDLIVLDRPEASLTFEGVASKPVPSWLREFSAPVKLSAGLTQGDRLFLARHDADPFNRWQALNDVAMTLLTDAARGTAWSGDAIGALAAALGETVTSSALDPAFKALALELPSEAAVARTLAKDIDPDRIHALTNQLAAELVAQIGDVLTEAYHASAQSEPYAPNAAQTGLRSLRNAALRLLVGGRAAGADALAVGQYEGATNMTDRMAALGACVRSWTADAQRLLDNFRVRFATDPLVYDKWLGLNAVAPDDGVIDRLRAIRQSPDFPASNPNRLRSLFGTFATANAVQFARADGDGFRFVTEFVADVDPRNPQVAARGLTAFRTWQSYTPKRREAAFDALKALKARGGLSRNSTDILDRMLEPQPD